MKAILCSILSLAVLAPATFAAPKSKNLPPPVGSSLYRPVPKTSNDTGKSRFRVTSYVPTQFYYTRDNVISYRYTSVAAFAGSTDSSDYLGPKGARFVPQEDDLPPSAAIRSYAAVTRRSQPGVGMVAPTPVKAPVKKTTSITPVSRDLAAK